MLAFQCLHKIYQIHYESNIKVNISNTIDNFYGAPLDYHCTKKKTNKQKKSFALILFQSMCFPLFYIISQTFRKSLREV